MGGGEDLGSPFCSETLLKQFCFTERKITTFCTSTSGTLSVHASLKVKFHVLLSHTVKICMCPPLFYVNFICSTHCRLSCSKKVTRCINVFIYASFIYCIHKRGFTIDSSLYIRPSPSKYVRYINTQHIIPVHYPHITLVHLLPLYPNPLTPHYLSQLTPTLPQSTNPTLAQSTYPHITLTHLPLVHYPYITPVNLPLH